MAHPRHPAKKRRPTLASPAKLRPIGPGRKPKRRPASVRRKNLKLDQKKLDRLRRSLGLSTDQDVVAHVIDEAVADRDLIDATMKLGGTLPDIVDIGARR